MVRLLGILILFFIVSCKSQGASNSYLEAKHHPSEKIANEQKKASKKAQKTFLKQQKKNQKSMAKIEAKKNKHH